MSFKNQIGSQRSISERLLGSLPTCGHGSGPQENLFSQHNAGQRNENLPPMDPSQFQGDQHIAGPDVHVYGDLEQPSTHPTGQSTWMGPTGTPQLTVQGYFEQPGTHPTGQPTFVGQNGTLQPNAFGYQPTNQGFNSQLNERGVSNTATIPKNALHGQLESLPMLVPEYGFVTSGA